MNKATSNTHLKFLDGLRGLAALYVIFGHVVELQMTAHPMLQIYLRWIWHPIFAVDVFIVLSGYCLMLPVARSSDGRLLGGLSSYFKRRASRILPGYYAALVLSILYSIVVVTVELPAARGVHQVVKEIGSGSLLSHVLLLHNLRLSWELAFNPPLWSVALEWQIYFLFAGMLLPLYRKFGVGAALLAAFVVGVAPHFLLPELRNFDWTRPWMVILFTFGMMGALVSSSERSAVPLRQRLPWPERVSWGFLALAGYVILLAVQPFVKSQENYQVHDTGQIAADLLMGGITTCLLIYCAQWSQGQNSGPRPIVLRLLTSPFALAVGTVSYSLYLVHFPITYEMLRLTSVWHLPAGVGLVLHLILSVVLSLLAAQVFFSLFERPFLSRRRTAIPELEPAAALSPAP